MAAVAHPSKSPTPAPVSFGEKIVLGTLTALIVARPLIAGDDPGRLNLTSGGGPLFLNLLTFLLLLGWGVWHGATRRRLVIGPHTILVIGLIAISVCMFISAGQPKRYQRPGGFIAWDWLGYAALCFIAGQMAATPAIARGLVAVLIATGGCLAFQAFYDEAAGSHRAKKAADPPAIPLVGDDFYDLKINQPAPPRAGFRATLDQPDTLAGLLLLIAPALVIWALAGWRGGGRTGWLVPMAIAVLIAAAMALVAWIVAAPITGKGWSAATLMIREQPLLGVGPGNFSRHAPRGLANADSFWLGTAATTGMLAIALIVLTIAAAVWIKSRNRVMPPAPTLDTSGKEYRWSFYLGGVSGLALGLMLGLSDLPVEAPGYELLKVGGISACRALVWLLIFAALELSVPATRALHVALGIGVLIVALLGIVSNGLASPALMIPFAVACVLALSRPVATTSSAKPSLPAVWVGASCALALLIANFIHVGLPGLVTTSAAGDARLASVQFSDLDSKTIGPTNPDRVATLRKADDYLIVNILKPLKDAAKLDSGNSALFSEIARWERWHVHYLFELTENERGRQRMAEILHLDEVLSRIDARNPAPRFSQYEAMMLLLHHSAEATPAQLARIERLIQQILEFDAQREIDLCFRVAQVLLTRRNPEAADPWAVRIFQLDAEVGEAHGKLSTGQRRILLTQLKKIKTPSPELAAWLKRA